jgi:uncharacterized delta-60 repeat protein
MRNRSQPSVGARLSAAARQAAPSVATVEPVERRVLLSAGQLDPTFGTGGTRFTTASTTAEETAVAALPNGDLLVADDNGQDGSTLTRLTATGAVDTTFGTDGQVALARAGVDQILLRPNGDILTVGGPIEQLLPSGAIDTTFGNAGLLPIEGDAAALGPDGSLVVSTGGDALQRCTDAGQLDTSFGTNGTATIPTPAAGSFTMVSFAVDAGDGVVVAYGFRPNDPSVLSGGNFEAYVVTRLTSAGQLDTSFAHSGFTPYGDAGDDEASDVALALAPDGTIYVGETNDGTNTNGIVAFTPTGGAADGDLFGIDGVITSVTVGPDGKPVATGYEFTEQNGQDIDNNLFVARGNAAAAGGGADTTFNGSGQAQVNYNTGVYDGDGDYGESVAVAADVVVAGVSNQSEDKPPVYEYTVTAFQGETAAILPGTVTGTAGSYLNQGNTVANAFDGNLNTFFDGPTNSGDVAGLDLGAPQVVREIQYAPRSGWAGRMVGGVFQGSNTPDFSSGVDTLYTITAAPAQGVYTTAVVSNPTPFEYVRYVAPNGSFGDVAEIQFVGYAPPAPAVLVNGVLTVSGTSGNDSISIDEHEDYQALSSQTAVDVNVNGHEETFVGDITQVVVVAGAGNDGVGVMIEPNTENLVGVSVNGGAGDDFLGDSGDGYVTLNGGDGNDTLGAGGDDTAYVTMLGGAGDDVMTAGLDAQADMQGGDGNDTFNDNFPSCPITVIGGTGTDTFNLTSITSGPVSITLDGKPDSDILYGNSEFGADIENVNVGDPQHAFNEPVSITGDALGDAITVYGNFGDTTINGGAGNDTLTATGGDSSSVQLFGNGGDDRLVADNFGGQITLNGGDGNDTLVGSAQSENHYLGGAGIDVVDYSARTDNLQVYLDGSHPSGDPTADVPSKTSAPDQIGNQDTFDGTVEEVYGGSGNDLLVAAPGGGDALYGGAGNDTLVAQGGADALFGGDGNDTFQAADGGPTYIDGGAGTDTAYIDATGDTTVNVENVIKPTPTPTPTTTQLTGTTYGTVGSYGNIAADTIKAATDGNLNTFFEAPQATGGNVGIDLGSAKTVTQIKFAPRSGFASRMVGGVFQYSTSPTFASGITTVYTITAAPASGVLTTVNISAPAERYWRYLGPTNGYCDIAEFQLFGPAAATTPPPPTQLTGTTYGTVGSYGNIAADTIVAATDGNLNTFFDAPQATGGNVGINLGSAKTVTQIKFAPRSGFASRMVGGMFQVSTSPTFASNVTTVYTITTAPASGVLTTVNLSLGAAYQYWRYIGPANGYCDIAEFQLFG